MRFPTASASLVILSLAAFGCEPDPGKTRENFAGPAQPRTRVEAPVAPALPSAKLKDDADFARLIARPACDRPARIVRTNLFTAELDLPLGTPESGDAKAKTCRATVSFLIDEATGRFRAIARCDGDAPSRPRIVDTTDYARSGDTLNVPGFGKISRAERGDALLLVHERSDRGAAEVREESDIALPPRSDAYRLFCTEKPSAALPGRR